MKLKPTADGGFNYLCPCGDTHHLKGWSFNGDHERPTFSPSVLVRSGHYISTHKPGDRCWCTYRAEHPEKELRVSASCYLCHSFVTDGMVQFLSDCTHPLAGQTVAIPEWSWP